MTLQELKACKTYRDAIHKADDGIARIRDEMERITQMLTFAPTSDGGRDKMAAQIARLISLEAERTGRVCALEAHIEKIEAWLITLPEQQATIMRLRYVEGLEWTDVATNAHYSLRHCTKIHQAATKKMPINAHQERDKIVL